MSDALDLIIAGGSGAGSRYDFSTFGDPAKSYWEGKDQRAKNDLREAFKGGVPTLPDGSIDYGTMQRTLYQKGGLEQGNALSGISARASEMAALDRADNGQPSTNIGPPSASRGASVTSTPSANRGGAQPEGAPQSQAGPQGTPQGGATVMTVLAAQGIPNHQLQAASESIARQLGVDPTAPLNLQDPQVRNVLAPAVAQLKRMGIGQVAQAGQPANQPIPAQPVQVAPQNDPVLKRLTILAASQDKQIAAAAKVRLEAYLKNQELTQDQKNAAAAGQSLTDYQNRTDENTTQRDILTKSILPRVDKSQEAATAARDDVDAIYRARAELDKPGGIINGAFADKRLFLSKAANLLGVPNADKINNTEAYTAAIGQRVAVMVKAFGSGTAISDGDRRFAAAMAGGNIDLDEKSMRRILDIGEKAARGKIDYHNTLVEKVIKSNDGLKAARDTYVVQAPDAYKKAEALPTLEPGKTKMNGLTYKGGNPKDRANWVR